jgi:hypothetical protein
MHTSPPKHIEKLKEYDERSKTSIVSVPVLITLSESSQTHGIYTANMPAKIPRYILEDYKFTPSIWISKSPQSPSQREVHDFLRRLDEKQFICSAFKDEEYYKFTILENCYKQLPMANGITRCKTMVELVGLNVTCRYGRLTFNNYFKEVLPKTSHGRPYGSIVDTIFNHKSSAVYFGEMFKKQMTSEYYPWGRLLSDMRVQRRSVLGEINTDLKDPFICIDNSVHDKSCATCNIITNISSLCSPPKYDKTYTFVSVIKQNTEFSTIQCPDGYVGSVPHIRSMVSLKPNTSNDRVVRIYDDRVNVMVHKYDCNCGNK